MPKLYALYTLEARVCFVPKTFRFEVFKFSGSGIPLAAHVVFSNFESRIDSIPKCGDPLAGRISLGIMKFAFTLTRNVGPPPNSFWGVGEQTNAGGKFCSLTLNLES